jgi:hypothetical protein
MPHQVQFFTILCLVSVIQFPSTWHMMASLDSTQMLLDLNTRACFAVGPIAQSVEQRTFNPWVDGSSPSGPTYVAHQIKHFKALRTGAL